MTFGLKITQRSGNNEPIDSSAAKEIEKQVIEKRKLNAKSASFNSNSNLASIVKNSNERFGELVRVDKENQQEIKHIRKFNSELSVVFLENLALMCCIIILIIFLPE